MLMALAGLWYVLALVCGIASLVFFIMVVVQMFKHDQTNLGIICIVLTFCTGVGPLIAFIYGWMKSTEWNIKKTMTYWTVCFVLQFLFLGLVFASAIGAAATMDPNDFNIDSSEFNIDLDDMDIEIEMDASDFEFTDDLTEPAESGTE